jgi:hypothetical protein
MVGKETLTILAFIGTIIVPRPTAKRISQLFFLETLKFVPLPLNIFKNGFNFK